MQARTITLTYSTSRGQYTHGFPIVRLHDGDKTYKCCGLGFNLLSAVLADWLQDNYQDRLKPLKAQLAEFADKIDYYGLAFDKDGKAIIAGGCGQASMYRIAEAIGLQLTEAYGKRGRLVAYTVIEA